MFESFLSNLDAPDSVQRLEESHNASKEDFLDAEVQISAIGQFDASQLRFTEVRPAFCRNSRLLLVDVSRLPSP